LYGFDIAYVAVGMGLIEDKIRPLDEDACGRANVRTAHTKPRKIGKRFDLYPKGFEDAFGGGWVVETDVGVDLNQIFACLRKPEEIS
jgi:hypothetical protein